MKNAVFWDVTPCGSLRTDVSASIRVTRICELATTLVVTNNRRMLTSQALRSSETPVLTRATRQNIPEDGFLQLHAIIVVISTGNIQLAYPAVNRFQTRNSLQRVVKAKRLVKCLDFP
jgi:hypothetical protein